MNASTTLRSALAILLLALSTACGSLKPFEASHPSDETPLNALSADVEQLFPTNPLPSPSLAGMVDETPSHWFVELEGAPLADGRRNNDIAREQRNFRADAARGGIDLQERFQYQRLFNGFSVAIPADDVAALARLRGVKAIYPVETISLPELETQLEPELATALAMTGADYAQGELGYSGTGIRVAVMDTGIDYDHGDLGGCFGPGCRVAFGYDLVGDAFNADPTSPQYSPVPAPDDDPDDCQGHGTHVAGIIGANGAVTGVAPDVEFGAYRVFGCEGSTTADIMLAAMERAYLDDIDVLNMSIGSAFQWPQYPTALAADRLVNKGVVVVASIGNSGASGLYSAGSPGLGKKVIGVASFDNSHISALSFEVEGYTVPYLPLSVTPDPPTSGSTSDIVYVGEGCDADPYLEDPDSKIALILRGNCTFDEKYSRAHAAGAEGVIIQNDSPGLFSGGGVIDKGIFGVAISLSDGNEIRSRLGEGVDLTWTDNRVNAENPTGNLISGFSSYGLSPDLDLKPDLGAPGGLIRSTYLDGSYEILSGTSMSSPHVAGAVALLLEARPNTPSQAVRGILQNSAVPVAWWGNPAIGFLDGVNRQGAGMLDIAAAIESETRIEPAKIALGESQSGPVTTVLTIENSSSEDVTYSVGHEEGLATAGTFAPGFFAGFANVSVSAPTIMVPAGASDSLSVTITDPGFVDGLQYGGYIVLTGDNGYVSRVPYAGVAGDYQSLTVLEPSEFEFPWLASVAGASYVSQPGGASYSMSDGDVPHFLLHLAHHSRRLRAEVFDASSGRAMHRAFDLEYLPRNDTPNGFFALGWDGVTQRGNRLQELGDGDYVVKLSVQKALGDDDTSAHWETWTSPVITIDRRGSD